MAKALEAAGREESCEPPHWLLDRTAAYLLGNAPTPDPESAACDDECDEFIAAVPWDEHRTILMFIHEFRYYELVRWRTWNLHRVKNVWYPTKRFFMLPLDKAAALAGAIREASIVGQLAG